MSYKKPSCTSWCVNRCSSKWCCCYFVGCIMCCNCCCCTICGGIRHQCCNNKTFESVPDENSIRLVFGSCNYHQVASKHASWTNITSLNPNVVILMGDNVYLDRIPPCWSCCGQNTAFLSNGLECLVTIDGDEAYKELMQRQDFSKLMHTKSAILATWDNHDAFAEGDDLNDTTQGIQTKQTRKKQFMTFLNGMNDDTLLNDQMDEINKRKDRGIYYFYDEIKNKLKIRVYMLDARWYRDYKQQVLGEEQFAWLKDAISDAVKEEFSYHIFVTSSTMMQEQAKCYMFKVWEEEARNRFFEIIDSHKLWDKSIILSGDLHVSVGYEYKGMYEFVSSSMTHSKPSFMKYGYKLQYFWNQIVCGNTHFANRVSDYVNVNGFGCIDFNENGFQFGTLNNSGHARYHPVSVNKKD